MNNTINGIFFILSCVICFSACVKNEETRGYVADNKRLQNIQKDSTTKDDVIKIMGSPSYKSTFGDEKWYYISMKTEHVAFVRPDIVEQDTYIITFDKIGKVKNIEKQAGASGRNIDIAKDITPTEGNKVTIFQQLLGNLGKFNPKDTE